jgi:hypothetical protein
MTSVLRPPTSGPGPGPSSVVGPPSSVLRPQPQPRLAYILAASHSGSTLLAMLLGAHPEACTVGELKGASRGHADTYRCSCGERIRECAFWQKVSAAMQSRGHAYDVTSAGTDIKAIPGRYPQRLLRPLHRTPGLELVRDTLLNLSPAWRAHLRRTQARNAALVETLLEVSQARVLVDSSKTGLRLKYLLRNPRLDVRVLRLFRDGRGVSLTHTNPAEFADASAPHLRSGGTGGPGHTGLSMREAAALWKDSNAEADRITATLPASQCLTIRYEELCQNPAGTMAVICRFLELEPYDPGRDFRARKQQHVVGNGMRMDTTSEIRHDERWKTHLSAEDLKTFDRVAGDLNRHYGYT